MGTKRRRNKISLLLAFLLTMQMFMLPVAAADEMFNSTESDPGFTATPSKGEFSSPENEAASSSEDEPSSPDAESSSSEEQSSSPDAESSSSEDQSSSSDIESSSSEEQSSSSDVESSSSEDQSSSSDIESSSSEEQSSSSNVESSSSEEQSSSSDVESSSSEEQSSSSDVESSSSEDQSSSSDIESSSSEDQSSSSDVESSSSEDQSSSSDVESSSSSAPEQPDVIIITSFEPLEEYISELQIASGIPFDEIEMPSELTAYDGEGGQFLIQDIYWLCDDYSSDNDPGDTFKAVAELPSGYQVAEGTDVPSITIRIDDHSLFAINDRIVKEGIIYKEINSTQAQVVGYTDDLSGDATIYSEVEDETGKKFEVISIEAYAFENCERISSAVIGDSIKSIGVRAFMGSKIAAVDIGQGVESIEQEAFKNCASLKAVSIPANVKQFSTNVFLGSGLEEVTLEEGITSVWVNAFSSCSSLKKVFLPSSLKGIGSYAFSDCSSLTDIQLPQGLTNIASYAFYGCGSLKEIEIPDGITSIDSYVFYNCTRLDNVILPDTLEYISYYAFASCDALESVDLPDGLSSIGGYAFANSGLTSIVIPENARLEHYAFSGCGSLASVTLPDKMTALPSDVFSSCKSLTSITLPPALTQIGSYAFSSSGLTSVTFPNSLRTISYNAFANTKLTSVSFPASLISIGRYAFTNTQLTNITVPEGVTKIDEYAFSNISTMNQAILPNSLTSLGNYVFSDCTAMHSAIIGGNDAVLGNKLFSGCTAITQVELTGTFSSIAQDAFAGANDTYEVTVPNIAIAGLVRDSLFDAARIKLKDGSDHGLASKYFTVDGVTYTITDQTSAAVLSLENKSISSISVPQTVTNGSTVYTVTAVLPNAFQSASVTDITLPDTVTSIGQSAFYSCASLNQIYLPKNLVSIGDLAFYRCTALQSVDLPESLRSIGSRAFQLSGLTSIIIPGVESISWYAFAGCQNLKSVTLSSGITNVSSDMFSRCLQLSDVELPDTLVTIEANAFYNCSSLKQISLPNTLTRIGGYAFYSSGLENIVIPDSVTLIENDVFSSCSRLRTVQLSKNLSALSYRMFLGCTSLQSVAIPENVTYIGQYCFDGCTSLSSLQTPEKMASSLTIGAYAFRNCPLTSIRLAEGIGIIDTGVFYGCSSLTEAVLPTSLVTLGKQAFYGTGLVNITIPDKATSIGEECFWNCTDLGTAVVGNAVTSIGLRAFPPQTQLVAGGPDVQLLLVQYLSQNPDRRPQSLWDGMSNVPDAAIAAAMEDITISGSIAIEKGATVVVYKTITITGTLTVDGAMEFKDGAKLIITGQGKLTGKTAPDLSPYYTLDVTPPRDGKVTADQPYYQAGVRVILDVQPNDGFRLKPRSLRYNADEVTADASGVYSFIMPAAPVQVTAAFDQPFTISEPDTPVLMEGKTVQLMALLPPEIDAANAIYSWTASPADAVTILYGDTDNVVIQANPPVTERDVTISVTVKIGQGSITASRTLHISTVKELVINERPAAAFTTDDILQLTITPFSSEVKWSSSDPDVAFVGAGGQVMFMGAGSADITAQSLSNPDAKDSVTLHVVTSALGTLSFEGGGKAAYKKIEIQQNGSLIRTVTTDGNGKFTVPLLGIGDYLLTSEPFMEGYAPLNQVFSVRKGDRDAAWNAEYEKCDTGEIVYTFLDTSGAPVPGVRAEIRCESPYQYRVLYSGDDGVVHFERLTYSPFGTLFALNYSTNDGVYDNANITLDASHYSHEQSAELPNSIAVTGRLVNHDGAGIAGIYVQIGNRSAYTNSSGTYSIRGKIETGDYDVLLMDREKYYYASGQAPRVHIAGENVTVPDAVVTTGITVTGRVLLDGRTDNYKKAYVTMRDSAGNLVSDGYGSGTDGFVLEGAIHSPGTYRLKIEQVFDSYGWYTVEFDTQESVITVPDLNQARIMVDLNAQQKLNASPYFSGDGNSLASDKTLVKQGDKFLLTVKYYNGEDQAVTADFNTAIVGGEADAGSQYSNTRHIVTVGPKESGRFNIQVVAGKTGSRTVSVQTTVTINGKAYDFACLSVEIANVTLTTRDASIGVGQNYWVYGEAVNGSTIQVYDADSGILLGTTTIAVNAGRWFSMELPGFKTEGLYKIYATANADKISAVSDTTSIDVSSNPIELKRVKVDQLDYDDLPVNERVGVRSFSHTVDSSLNPEPLTVRSQFSGGNVASVTYHFADNNYPATKDANGLWAADINNWRGTGLKQLTATVTAGGRSMTFTVAEVIVLVDPSGKILDADTGALLQGAEVTCYVKNADGSFSLWDSARYGQAANPWKTGVNGAYGWNVPDGVYRIEAQKDGYEKGYSDELEKYKDGVVVPPPALDVDLNLTPTQPMSLARLVSENNEIHAQFSRYVKAVSVAVKDPSGRQMPVEWQVKDDTVVITGNLVNDTLYTVELSAVKPKSGNENRYGLDFVSGTVRFSGDGDIPTQDPEDPVPDTSAPGIPNPDSPQSPVPNRTDRRPSGTRSSSGSKSNAGNGILSKIFSYVRISPETIRSAARQEGCAIAYIGGPNPKTSGKALADALGTLQPDERLILRNVENGRTSCQFMIDPATLTTLPDTLRFGLTLNQRSIRELFTRYFSNKMVFISLDQEDGFGFTADIAVWADLNGLDLDALRLFRYDVNNNSYTYLPDAAPQVDENGYLHFKAVKGGHYVLTDSEFKH